MRRHELSVMSLLSGLVFGTVAIVLLSTDGRLSSYDMHWELIWAVSAGLVGALLVAVAVRAIVHERRGEPPTASASHD
ncbi:MAG: hypothetical protein JWM93_1460 [Frankiales bacterium]|nr:hypothetical protein [Frankiales bacterium]